MNNPPTARDRASGQACPRMGEAGDARAPGKDTSCLVGPRRRLDGIRYSLNACAASPATRARMSSTLLGSSMNSENMDRPTSATGGGVARS